MEKKHLIIIVSGVSAFVAAWYALKKKQELIDNPEVADTTEDNKWLSVARMEPMMLALIIAGITIGAAYLSDIIMTKSSK